jgi:hypothetical protein
MEDPAQTPHDRGEAAVRAVKDYLGATAATALAQEGVDPAGLRFHQVYVEVQGDKTRLAPRYVVRFGPEGGILGMFAERSETPHPPALAGGRPARAPGR